MENNFDKYFKDNLDKREFEMKPHFWDEAEALIDAQEKSRWRKGLWFWFGIVLLSGSVIFYSWSKMSGDDSISSIEKEQVAAKKEAIKTTEIKTENIISETEKKEASKNVETNFSKNKIEENKNLKSNSVAQKSVPNISQQKSKTGITSNNFSKSIPPNSTKNELPNFSNNQGNQINIPITPNNDKTENVILEEKNESQNSKAPTDEANPKIESTTTISKPIATNLNLLPMLNLFLENKNKEVELEVGKACLPYSYSHNKTGEFEYGLTGGAVGYLVENSSDNPFIGMKGGGTFQYFLKDEISIGAELLYHYRSGNFVATKQFETVNYSFGRRVQNEKLTPKSLHYLELPIFLKYRIKKVSLELGASANYLLGVRGEVEKIEENISGWIPEDGFKKYYANVLLGIHFHFTEKTQFGIRANYTPGGILDKNAVLPNGDALQESGPIYLTFRATQYF